MINKINVVPILDSVAVYPEPIHVKVSYSFLGVLDAQEELLAAEVAIFLAIGREAPRVLEVLFRVMLLQEPAVLPMPICAFRLLLALFSA